MKNHELLPSTTNDYGRRTIEFDLRTPFCVRASLTLSTAYGKLNAAPPSFTPLPTDSTMVDKMTNHRTPQPDGNDGNDAHGLLGQIIVKLDEVLDRLAKGDTAIALLEHRVAFLEKIVYGLCSIILVTVIGAIVALVVRTHP